MAFFYFRLRPDRDRSDGSDHGGVAQGKSDVGRQAGCLTERPRGGHAGREREATDRRGRDRT